LRLLARFPTVNKIIRKTPPTTTRPTITGKRSGFEILITGKTYGFEASG